MNLRNATRAFVLLAPLATSCTSMGFPHIGTVDTRHKSPGSTHGQLSFGAGATVYPPTIGAGANLAFDTHVSQKTSLATSAHVLAGIGPHASFFPGARLGIRHRPSSKFSWGFGANANMGLPNGHEDPIQYGYGADFELATSRPLTRKRFNSHAWRVGFGVNPKQFQMLTFMGDWSRSIPTSRSNQRFSFGVNYGGFLHNSNSPLVNVAPPVDPNDPTEKRTDGFGGNLFVGAHLGIQFGSSRR